MGIGQCERRSELRKDEKNACYRKNKRVEERSLWRIRCEAESEISTKTEWKLTGF